MLKRLLSAALSAAMVLTAAPAVFAETESVDYAAAETAAANFDPETTMWTNRTIEDVLAQTGKYKTVQEVNPNADKSEDALKIQNPYGKPGENYESWDYSEFVWTNFYPIGNGRMAGMVAGGIDNEVIQINEDTCWDGSPYGTLVDESGKTISTMEQAYNTKGKITVKDGTFTSGSKPENWRYFRGADENGNPAEIGAADVLVGDEAFRLKYPDFANKSIANQALNINNAKDQAAVQDRWSMEKMVEATFLGTPSKQRAYKSFAEVFLNFGHKSSDASNYAKSLDMETGIVTVEYDLGGAHYKRESFASYPDQVVATHVESSEAADFSAELHTYHVEKPGFYTYEKISDKEVKVKAAVTHGGKDNNIAQTNMINFEARMYLDGDGAFSVADDNKTVNVKGGTSNTIYVVGATNYVDYKTLDNDKPARDCEYYMNNVKSKTYEQIKARHLADFTEQFSKTDLTLDNAEGKDYSDTPTEERVREPKDGKSGFRIGAASKTADANKNGVRSTYSDGDNQLAALEFNYGKYLILSGSRDGRAASGAGEIDIPESQPLNLTGKWNAAFSASWNGKYTININTEMNYWAAQPLNIGDSERPFIDTFKELAESGSYTAEYQYGIGNSSTYQPGDPWVMHHNYDLWRGTQPIDNATAGLWPTGGAWLLDHAWQYYKFNKDEDYLAEVYPYMVGAAKFFTQFLVVDPKTGYLITAASCSPEQGGVQPGPAMDTQLVRNLYDMVQQASKILGKERENADLLAKIKEQMPSSYLADEQGKVAPNVIDKAGLISEWVRGDVSFDISKKDSGQWTVKNPFKSNEETKVYDHEAKNTTNHRHCSHLWEIFPGTHLSGYSDDPNEQAIFKAYQKSVSARSTGSGQGWGLAWRINLNARALDGNAASTMLEQLFTTRTSPNLFDQHPNFQIDGNYGATSGILEMLIQSHDGAITLLPALPDKWTGGEYKGFKTREGATVDLKWSGSKPVEAKIHATETKDISVRSKYMSEAQITDESGNAVAATLNDDRTMATFPAQAGKTYTITNFGSNVTEGSKVYKASDVKEFYSSNNNKNKPSPSSSGIGSLRNLDGVKVGYAVDDVDFDGLKSLTLNMASVRYGDTYVAVMLDTVDGTEIAKQLITTGDNVLDLKNTANIGGTHKIWLLFWQDPFDGGESINHKYLGDSSDLTGFYSKTTGGDTNPTAAPKPTATAAPTATPAPAADYDYEITSASYGADGTLGVSLSYNGTETGPKAKLMVGVYDESDEKVMLDSAVYDIEGAEIKNLDFKKPSSGKVKLYVWDGTDTIEPKSSVYEVGTDVPASTPTTAPTTNPTLAPTLAPTSKPTAAPTADPSAKGAYIGDTKYNTISEAVAAAAAKAPESEADRVYIDIAPGTYREQIVVKTPYITLRKKAGSEGDALLTWYYGLGSLYDSCNESGYYDPQAIGDGVSYGPKDWGPALKVDKTATGFTAENLILENSYNRYYTEEELTDITGVDPDTNNGNFHRVEWINEQKAAGKSDDEINAYLQSRDNITYKGVDGSPRERCAALHCSADKAVFLNCEIISTQDTIGINTGRMYFKNCKLGGTTDYICGSATAVFDNCELYVNAGGKGESATLTAPSNTKESEGYLFYNCYVTGSNAAQPGNMGRPWGAPPGPAAAYINTKIGNAAKGSSSDPYLISSSGWTDMSGNKPEEARFYEYGSVDDSGKAVEVSKRRGQLLDEWTMLRYNPYTFTKGSDDWDPAGVKSKYDGVDSVINSANIDTSNQTVNEIDLPAAPSGYEFKWASDSEFATVNGNKLSLIRPANGEQPIDATVKLYVRDASDKSIGTEKSISFEIQPTADTTNVFSIGGTISVGETPAAEDVPVRIRVMKNNAVIKSQTVTVPKGQTSAAYTVSNIPLGTYDVLIDSQTSSYRVFTPDEGAGAAAADTAGQSVTIDISLKGLIPVSKAVTTAPTAIGSGATVTDLGDGKFNIKASSGVDGGAYWDLVSIAGAGLAEAETVTLKYTLEIPKVLANTDGKKGASIDFTTNTPGKFSDGINDARITRTLFGRWDQVNMFDAGQAGQNTSAQGEHQWLNCTGDQFKTDADCPIAYDFEIEADFKNKKVTPRVKTVVQKGSPVQKDWFTKDDFTAFPTNIDRNKLSLAIYTGTGGAAEYNISNISVNYTEFAD